MASDGTTPAGGDRPGVKLCCFPAGNATEFPYPLSIHGAWMLERGIGQHTRGKRGAMHESGEDPSYCRLMTLTAIEQAEKLREWALRVAPDYLEGTIRDLDRLLGELAAQRDRFAALASQGATGEKTVSLDDLFGPAGARRQEGSPDWQEVPQHSVALVAIIAHMPAMAEGVQITEDLDGPAHACLEADGPTSPGTSCEAARPWPARPVRTGGG